ncbi:mitochondrial import inner membrane translocase subunit Tim10B [Ochlerotatus camptorhynchus]|uniref:mitochondrial import inner membrane translocase subunit Tim10B n=1 Tax=Ochlerotatus camptorhynchus TaxID=644619 RepID=UPI0031DA3976
MDFELRNLKDFLTLYNQVTELCFKSCVDNFFGRDLSSDELRCTDNCVAKFSNVNQRLMKVYVGVQTDLNQRRMVEFEAQQAKLQEAQKQQEQTQVAELAPTADASLTLPASATESPAATDSGKLETTVVDSVI